MTTSSKLRLHQHNANDHQCIIHVHVYTIYTVVDDIQSLYEVTKNLTHDRTPTTNNNSKILDRLHGMQTLVCTGTAK